MLRLRQVDPAKQPWPTRRRERAIRQQNRDRAGATGQSCQRLGEILHRRIVQHLLDHDLVDLAGALARNHQAGANLAQLDAVGDIEYAVENAEAGIRSVVNGNIPLDTEGRCDLASRRRFKMLATDTGVNHRTNIRGGNVALAQRLPGRGNGTFRDARVRLPPAPFADTGQRLQLPWRNMQGVVHWLQPVFQFG